MQKLHGIFLLLPKQNKETNQYFFRSVFILWFVILDFLQKKNRKTENGHNQLVDISNLREGSGEKGGLMRLYDTKYPKPIALDDNIAYREAIDYVKEKSKPGEKLYYDGRESIIVQVHPNGIVCTVLSGMFNTFLTWDELVRNGVLYFSAEVQNGVLYFSSD